MVDIASGIAGEIRVDRRRFRFAAPDDIDAAWVDHHFVWQRDAAGRDRLQPRERFTPWPWRARVRPMGADAWQLDVPRIDHAFVAILKTRLQPERGVQVTDTSGSGDPALAVTLDGCLLQVHAFGVDGSSAEDHRLSAWPDSSAKSSVPAATCEPALRRLATIIDAELATGRHDMLLKLD